MSKFVIYKDIISQFLVDFLLQEQEEFSDTRLGNDYFKRLLPLLTAGKMLRGSLLINTYQNLSQSQGRDTSDLDLEQSVLAAAAALELAETAFLIHDDIIDQDSLRRGHKTLHTQYASLAEKQKYPQAKRFGESLALCGGDIVFFLLYKLLPLKLSTLFSQKLLRTALGEMDDVEQAAMPINKVSKQQILQMYLDKTATYSLSLPLMAGVTLIQQNKKVLSLLDELGKNLGLIFQLKDDEIGLFGDPKQTGKAAGADIREKKKTLYYYYLNQVKPGAFETQTPEKIMKLIKKHQIDQQVTKELETLEIKVRKQLDFPGLTPLKPMLEKFLEMNLKRKK